MKRLTKLITIVPLVTSSLISQPVHASTVVEADALVIAPPSNVRVAPNGRVMCQVKQRKVIQVFHWSLMTGEGSPSNGWYSTQACGQNNGGWIHSSQIKLLEDWRPQGIRPAKVIEPPSNIRESPNGKIVCQVKRRNEQISVTTYDQKGKWYSVTSNECSGYMHNSQFRIIYH